MLKIAVLFGTFALAVLGIGAFIHHHGTLIEAASVKNVLDFKMRDIDGKDVKLKKYKGQVLLVVNVGSKCGYTPQYKGLQELYTKYGDTLVVIGFPCYQFLGQEPGSNEEIAEFCEKNYGVTFPIATKLDVKGKNQHPIYKWVTSKSENGVEDSSVAWNFHKFLIGPNGQYIAGFGSRVEPMSAEITALIK